MCKANFTLCKAYFTSKFTHGSRGRCPRNWCHAIPYDFLSSRFISSLLSYPPFPLRLSCKIPVTSGLIVDTQRTVCYLAREVGRMSSFLNQHVLVLNRLWQAVNVCTARRALTLVFEGHAQVVFGDTDGAF